jgi:hypothetical protein
MNEAVKTQTLQRRFTARSGAEAEENFVISSQLRETTIV